MENSSKALIIAGAILISILLISVGILVFNSTSGVTDNAGEAGDAMMLAAAAENSKIILGTMDMNNEDTFVNYIISTYGGNRTLTASEVKEMCELIKERTLKITGSVKHSHNHIHITCIPENSEVYQTENGDINYNSLENDKLYKITCVTSDAGGKKSIYVKK